jgi:hypothetical protein
LLQPKFTPVFTIRMEKRGALLASPVACQLMIDASVPREIMLKVLKDAYALIAAGRSPAEIALLRL